MSLGNREHTLSSIRGWYRPRLGNHVHCCTQKPQAATRAMKRSADDKSHAWATTRLNDMQLELPVAVQAFTVAAAEAIPGTCLMVLKRRCRSRDGSLSYQYRRSLLREHSCWYRTMPQGRLRACSIVLRSLGLNFHSKWNRRHRNSSYTSCDYQTDSRRSWLNSAELLSNRYPPSHCNWRQGCLAIQQPCSRLCWRSPRASS